MFNRKKLVPQKRAVFTLTLNTTYPRNTKLTTMEDVPKSKERMTTLLPAETLRSDIVRDANAMKMTEWQITAM
jgi:hypothetical protein